MGSWAWVTLMLGQVMELLRNHPGLRHGCDGLPPRPRHHVRSSAHVWVWLSRPRHCRGGDVVREAGVSRDDDQLPRSPARHAPAPRPPGV